MAKEDSCIVTCSLVFLNQLRDVCGACKKDKSPKKATCPALAVVTNE